MSDLIERLTALAILSPPGATRLDLHHRRLIREAADEIERLRLSCKGVEGWRDDRPDEIEVYRLLKRTRPRSLANLARAVAQAYAAPVSPSPLMDFGASQVRHQPSAATSPEGSDPTQAPCPARGEIRVIDGKRCRFIERELEGDKWEILGPAEEEHEDG